MKDQVVFCVFAVEFISCSFRNIHLPDVQAVGEEKERRVDVQQADDR